METELLDLGNGVMLEMILVPAGKFSMGSLTGGRWWEGEDGGENLNNDEVQHEVTITKPFYMGKYEVTQVQWYEIMESNPSSYKGKSLPVTNVSWNDCQDFIKKLNEKTKGENRLPTEAEWEYAGRAGTTTGYSFGENITPKDANIKGSKVGKPVVVGSYKANAFGLYDMHGNVWEGCEDWYGAYPKGSVTDPRGPDSGENRVMRGGAFCCGSWYSRSAGRVNYTPDSRCSFAGLRLTRTP